jgi:hypothetical protein
MNLALLLSTIVMTSWQDVMDLFGEANDIFGGYLALIGLLVVLFFLMVVLMLRFTLPLVAIVMIPVIFWVSSRFALGDMLIILGIMVGIMFGIALLKWYRR